MKGIKKSYLVIAGVLIWLGGCWLMGQPQRENRNNNVNIMNEQEVNAETDLNAVEDDITFEGYKKVDNNPWNMTAGKFEMEGEGKYILLTPNTAVQINDPGGRNGEINFMYQIHPWVKDASDGAGLLLWVLDKKDEILYAEEITINAGEDWKEYKLDLTQYEGATSVKIFCNNGVSGDDSGDWAVLKFLNTDSLSATFASSGYVRSATYFAEEWPINFWNSEMDYLDDDMEQIKKDGFDSIILVIPWREFQPQINPIQYNENAFSVLDKVMKAADVHGLNVYARIGYSWDYYNDANENIVDRFCSLLYDEQARTAWFDYVAKMYDELSKFENFEEGFLTWEDFWNNLGICDDLEESRRLERAKQIGYGNWVEQSYSLEEYNKKYGTQYNAYNQIAIPQRDEPAMYAMYEYYDDFLITLLSESQEIFPNLSMEVRMDWDVTYNKKGKAEYYEHTDTFGCGDSNYTATMYGIPMGFENVGERVSYHEGLKKTEYILSQLQQQNGNKDIYVEQFIFADNTPAYKNNAQIKEDEIDEYLENVSDILLNYTAGYGIWTYKNYRANMIYNSQFALEDEGWECEGNIEFPLYENSITCELGVNSAISQKIPSIRNHFDSDKYKLEISIIDVIQPGNIQISVGDEVIVINVTEEENVELNIKKNSSFDIEVKSANSKLLIDNIKLYSQVQNGFLYDENGNELSCIGSLRLLNSSLQ